MKRLTLLSPAKLNLFLKVINKRPDGYHNLSTLFERIDLCDELEFSLNKKGTIHIDCNHPDVPTDQRNLVYKVAKLLKDDFALDEGVDVVIEKRIPVAAGLGGGSSNAATTLLTLNQIWKLELSFEELLHYASQVGSDVPFFLYQTSWAWGQGRGEILEKLEIDTQLWHVLVVAPVKLYAKDVFENLQWSSELERKQEGNNKNITEFLPVNTLSEDSITVENPLSGIGVNEGLTKPNSDVNILTRSLRQKDFSTIGNLLRNDLERAIIRLCPDLQTLKKELKQLNVKGVAFSGSGPAIFGLTQDKRQADELKEMLKKVYPQVFVVRTL